jgi:hypothetical protein
MAVGVYHNGYPATFSNSRDTIPPMFGMAVAIGPHHLLSCAHVFEFDTVSRPFDLGNCIFEYVPFLPADIGYGPGMT